ncbi:MAG: amidohydrolase [Alphaproteobacteria bacterium]|nr:MAG: amidohydrolase [Alphaproteobacteria bacterium]
MKSLLYLSLFLVIIIRTSLVSQAETIAITGGKVYSMIDNDPLTNVTILIVDEKIKAIGPNIKIPRNAVLINAKNKIITPGFMSSATHLGLTEVLAVSETNDFSGSDKAAGSIFDVSYGFNPNSTVIPIVRMGGLTRSIIIPSANQSPIAGLGAIIHLGSEGRLITHKGNALFVEMGEHGAKLAGGTRGAAWGQLKLLLDRAKNYRNKKNKGLIPNDLTVFMDILSKEIPLVATVDRASDIQQVIELAEDYNIRAIIMGGAESWMVADQLAQANIPVILDPTLNFPDLFETINARHDTATLLHKAGVKMGFSMPRLAGLRTPAFTHNANKIRISAGIAVANGLPYLAALKALSIDAAHIWGIDKDYGTLQKGRDADIVIWSDDPLEIMTNAEIVIIKGHIMPKTNRQIMLRDRYFPAKLNDPIPPKYR